MYRFMATRAIRQDAAGVDGEGVDAGALALSVVVEDVAGVLLSEPAEGVAAGSVLAASPPPSVLAAGLLPLLRKSVWYQPLPFSWNPAAETSLLNASLPHAGQVVSGASLNFCKVSSLWPHWAQRYS
jgi:hypothetical protein